MRAYFRVADGDSYERPFDFTPRKFYAWSEHGLYSTKIADWSGNRSYGTFGALLTARMVSMLRSRGIGLSRIRHAHEFLCNVLGYRYPFVAKPIWTDSVKFPEHVYASIERDQYTADLFGQFIFPELAEIERVHHANLEFDGRPAEAAHWHIAPGVSIDPLTQGGVPCVKGRRVPTSVLWANIRAGLSATDVSDMYRVEVGKVEAALDWERRLDEVRIGAPA